jgi:hypothetical protein
MRKPNRIVVMACLVLCGAAVTYFQALFQAQTVPDLVSATNNFLVSLTPEQTAKVRYQFKDDERMNWYFVPMERNGLTFKEMQPSQQRLAFSMVNAALGQSGFQKATTIMSLEDVLRIQESGGGGGAGGGGRGAAPAAPAGGGAGAGGRGAPGGRGGAAPGGAGGAAGRGGNDFAAQGRGGRGGGGGFNRDPELHYITIFGEPSNTGMWGWRLEGHHMSINVTMDKGKFVASTPTFFGSNPAEVRDGPRKGLRALGREEDLGRELLASLDADQKKTAIVAGAAPNDIVTGNTKKAQIGAATGLPGSKMNAKQKDLLLNLIREYADRNAAEAANDTMAAIKKAGLDSVYFTWIGTETRGQAHYYRVQSPVFLIEYDNTQNGANHIHSVWRDLRNDWGLDVLAEHYKVAHLQQ